MQIATTFATISQLYMAELSSQLVLFGFFNRINRRCLERGGDAWGMRALTVIWTWMALMLIEKVTHTSVLAWYSVFPSVLSNLMVRTSHINKATIKGIFWLHTEQHPNETIDISKGSLKSAEESYIVAQKLCSLIKNLFKQLLHSLVAITVTSWWRHLTFVFPKVFCSQWCFHWKLISFTHTLHCVSLPTEFSSAQHSSFI